LSVVAKVATAIVVVVVAIAVILVVIMEPKAQASQHNFKINSSYTLELWNL